MAKVPHRDLPDSAGKYSFYKANFIVLWAVCICDCFRRNILWWKDLNLDILPQWERVPLFYVEVSTCEVCSAYLRMSLLPNTWEYFVSFQLSIDLQCLVHTSWTFSKLQDLELPVSCSSRRHSSPGKSYHLPDRKSWQIWTTREQSLRWLHNWYVSDPKKLRTDGWTVVPVRVCKCMLGRQALSMADTCSRVCAGILGLPDSSPRPLP